MSSMADDGAPQPPSISPSGAKLMLLLSWLFSGWTAFVAGAQATSALTPKAEVPGPSGVEVAVLAGVALLAGAKAVLEFKGWSLLRRGAVSVSPEIAALVRIWIPALVILTLQVLYMAITLTVVVIGIIWGILLTLLTLGFGWRQAWDNPLWSFAKTLWGWFEGELSLLQTLAAHPVGAVVMTLFAALMILGPAIAALLLLRRAKASPS